jgi:hypothetical protein
MRIRKKIQTVLWSDHAPFKTASIYRCTAIWREKLTYSTSPKALGPRSTRSSVFYARNLPLLRETAIKALAAAM